MSASACGSPRCASSSVSPSARLNEIVVASSASWWLIEVGVAPLDEARDAASGTSGVTVLLSALPVDASRSAGLADTARSTAGCRRRRCRGVPLRSRPRSSCRRRRRGAAGRGRLRRHVDVGERVRALRVARRPFHDHVVLVELAVDRRDLALAERVVERRVDRAEVRPRRDALSRSTSTQRLDAVVLLVGVDVGQRGRACFIALGEPRRPERAGRRGCRSSACTGRSSCSARPPARTSCTVLRKIDRPVTCASCGRSRAITAWPLSLRCRRGLRLTNMKPPPARAAAGEADDGVDRRIAADDVDDLAQLVAHRLRRDALVGAQPAVELAGVLLREEALRRGAEQVDVEADDRDQDEHHERPCSRAPSRGSPRTAAAPPKPRSADASHAAPGPLLGLVGRRAAATRTSSASSSAR